LDLEPGAYKLHSSLDGYLDGDFQFVVRAGDDIPNIFLKLVPATRQERPAESISWSDPLSPSKPGWQKAARLSLFGTENASGTYEFRIQRRGSMIHKSFSSWIVGYRPGTGYTEFRVEGQDLQWRKPGGSWNILGSVEIPNKATEIYVVVAVRPGAVTTAIGETAESVALVGKAVSLGDGLFGLTKDTQIGSFHHSR